ncbi:MAG: VanZ family protein [Erysipelotrichales bacterium]|nr:VanZ family protein [Erysipelotrichales bacterium]
MKLKSFFILIFVASFSIQLFYVISTSWMLTFVQKCVMLVIQMLSLVGWLNFEENDLKKYRIKQFMFFLYMINLLYVLLWDRDFGRNEEVLRGFEHINLNLFHTIELYVNGYKNGVVGLQSLMINLFGNFCLFMPMAYFLPVLFSKFKKWYVFLFVIMVLVFLIEVLQVFLQTGTGDIDDWFLNVSGAFVLYVLLRCVREKK